MLDANELNHLGTYLGAFESIPSKIDHLTTVVLQENTLSHTSQFATVVQVSERAYTLLSSVQRLYRSMIITVPTRPVSSPSSRRWTKRAGSGCLQRSVHGFDIFAAGFLLFVVQVEQNFFRLLLSLHSMTSLFGIILLPFFP